MLEEVWQSFIIMIPVFILLTLIFAAGFVVGRITKREQ
jgi:hypothetical protein